MSVRTRAAAAPAGPARWLGSTVAMRRAALAAVDANVGIVLTGAVVRLTGSGLGCPEWPRCTGSSLVPVEHATDPTVNMFIEFGNRLLTFVVLATAVACIVVAVRLRPRRRSLLVLAGLQAAGIAAQAVVGGLSVRYQLTPGWVSAHFLVSIAMIALAMALLVRAGEGDGPAVPVVRRELRLLAQALTAVVVLLLAAGTVVTGTGPHAGDASAARYPLRLDQVAQVHADLVWLTVGLTVALVLGLRLTDAGRAAFVPALHLLAVELAQGVVGYVQYAMGVPAPLVWLHVLGACLTWVATLRVLYATRRREPLPEPEGAPVLAPS